MHESDLTKTYAPQRQAFYVHLAVGNGAATLACVPDAGDFIAVGVAWCSPRDRFSRPRGRTIAQGRVAKLMTDVLDVFTASLEGQPRKPAPRAWRNAFVVRVPAAADSAESLRDLVVRDFTAWLKGLTERPWWTIDAEEPRVEPWKAAR